MRGINQPNIFYHSRISGQAWDGQDQGLQWVSSLAHQNQDAVGAEQCAEDGGGSGIMYLCSNVVILYGKGQ